MPKKRHTAAQIINKLRQAEVELSRGVKIAQVCRKLGVTEQTYSRWRKEYGGVRTDQAKRLKELEKENGRLKKLLAESEPDKAILGEAASGNFQARRSAIELLSTSRRYSRCLNEEPAASSLKPARPRGNPERSREMNPDW